ncbi:unnamed protein product, partial [Mesorhabditis belari]|uniref:NTR domain-containing protein n=1 Tax=Mesorhabditis belari TaxID=2138241 RepID=A0AAF3J436_9BILA
MKFLLVFCAFLSIAFACKCQDLSAKDAFCRATWVSHLKVKLRITKQPLPEGSTRKGLNNLRYGVEHLQVFKKPSNLSTLPNEIFTPSEPPACGLIVEAGREYLLAGSLNGDALYTVLCGQILPDNKLGETIESRLEWKNIPNGYEKVLQGFQC